MWLRLAALAVSALSLSAAAAPTLAPASGPALTQSLSAVAGTRPDLQYFDAATSTFYYDPAATGTFTISDSPSDSASTLAFESFPPAASYATEVTGDGPISYWRLGESSGTTAADAKGANTGTYKGGYTLGRTGALGDGNTAVLFNGTSGYVSLGSPASLQLDNGSVEAWFKTSGNSSYNAIVSTNNRFYVGVNPNGQLETWDPGANADRLTGVNVTDNAWHHVVVAFRSGVANGTKVYLDGDLVLSTTVTFPSQSGYVTIGSDGGSAEWFPGTIDDVAIYSAVLSQAQVDAHFAARANVDTTGFSVAAAWRTTSPWQSNTYTFDASNTTAPVAHTITVEDAAKNVASTTVTFVRDVTAPTVTAALSGGPWYATASVPLTLSATDASSGVDPAGLSLQRDETTLANGSCGTFPGSWTSVTLTGGADTTVQSGECYRYRYQATDRVGNQSTWATTADAFVDATAPTTPSLVLSATGTGSYVSGTTFYYRPQAAGGTLTVTATSSDTAAGLAKVRFPALAGGFTPTTATDDTTTPYAQTYTWPAGTGSETGAKTVTAYDQAGNTADQAFTIVPDSTAPTVTAALSGGPWYTTASVPLTTAAGSDTQSGVDRTTFALERDRATLSDGACGDFSGAWSPVTLTGGADTTVQSGECYRYRAEVSDNVGNQATSSPSEAAKVDTSAPAVAAAFTATSGSTYVDGAGTLYYRPGGGGAFGVTATLTDPQSGPSRVSFPAVAGFGNGAEVGAPGPYSAGYAYAGTPLEPGTIRVVGENAGGESAAAELAIRADSIAPTGVSATVAGGRTSATQVAVRLTDGTDSGSGVDAASGVVERAEATLSTDGCGEFAPWAPVTLVAGADASVSAGHCYRYRYRISDRVGNEAVSEPSDSVMIAAAQPVATAPSGGGGGGDAPAGPATAGASPAGPAAPPAQAGAAAATPDAFPAAAGPPVPGLPATPARHPRPAPLPAHAPARTRPPTSPVPVAPRKRQAWGVARLGQLRSEVAAAAFRVAKRVAQAAIVAGRHSSFPLALVLLVAAFLAVQDRIDRNDPKLADAPLAAEPRLNFERPDAD